MAVGRADEVLFEIAVRSSPERVSEEEKQRDPHQEYEWCDPFRSDCERDGYQNSAEHRGAEPFPKTVG